MPPSEMKPTRLATVSVCPVSTRASTPPMNAVGMALRICSTIRTDGKSITARRTCRRPTTPARTRDQQRRPLLALELPAVLDEVAFGQRHLARRPLRWMSATTLARSRPRALQRMTIRRRTFSRLTWFGPRRRRSADVGHVARAAPARGRSGRSSRSSPEVGVVGCGTAPRAARPGRTAAGLPAPARRPRPAAPSGRTRPRTPGSTP